MSSIGIERVELADATKAEIADFLTIQGIEGVKSDARIGDLRSLAEGAGFTHILRSATPMQVAEEIVRERQEAPYDPAHPEKERWCSITIQQDQENEGLGAEEPVFVGINEISCYIPRSVRVCVRELVYEHIKNCKEKRYPSTDQTGPLEKFKRSQGFWVDRYRFTFHGYKTTLLKDGVPQLVDGELLIAPQANADALKVSEAMQATRALRAASADYSTQNQA